MIIFDNLRAKNYSEFKIKQIYIVAITINIIVLSIKIEAYLNNPKFTFSEGLIMLYVPRSIEPKAKIIISLIYPQDNPSAIVPIITANAAPMLDNAIIILVLLKPYFEGNVGIFAFL